jgi:putative N6-adenine-specific DNA methylase
VERLTSGELAELEVEVTGSEQGGVSFRADGAGLCRAHLHLRTASRILVRLAEFRARDFPSLERGARGLDWDRFSRPGDSVAVRAASRKSRLYHQRAIAQRIEDAARLAGRDIWSRREGPSEVARPTSAVQTLYVRVFRDRCTVSVDATGAHLHRRGYRKAGAKAPLRETLAAAALLAIGWDRHTALLDPLCGSGTIPIEAALMAGSRAPGLRRSFACEDWAELSDELWAEARSAARRQARPIPAPIVGSDRDEGAIRLAMANAERAGVAGDLTFSVGALSAAARPDSASEGVLIANPPYGRRVGRSSDLRDLYAALGNLARKGFPGWVLGVIATDPALVGQVGIPVEACLSTRHGGLAISVWRGVIPGM